MIPNKNLSGLKITRLILIWGIASYVITATNTITAQQREIFLVDKIYDYHNNLLADYIYDYNNKLIKRIFTNISITSVRTDDTRMESVFEYENGRVSKIIANTRTHTIFHEYGFEDTKNYYSEVTFEYDLSGKLIKRNGQDLNFRYENGRVVGRLTDDPIYTDTIVYDHSGNVIEHIYIVPELNGFGEPIQGTTERGVYSYEYDDNPKPNFGLDYLFLYQPLPGMGTATGYARELSCNNLTKYVNDGTTWIYTYNENGLPQTIESVWNNDRNPEWRLKRITYKRQRKDITVPFGETRIGNVFGNSSNANSVGDADSVPTDNTVTINGTVEQNAGAGGSTYGAIANASWAGTATGDVTGNVVTVASTGVVKDAVKGGQSEVGGFVASNNIVIIDGTVNSTVRGGVSISGNANDNQVVIRGSAGNVVGGQSNSEGGTASGNTVTIDGGSVFDYVIGGQSNAGTAANNTVIIKGNPTFNVYLPLYGGQTFGTSSGNKLEMYSTNITIGEIKYFQTINFYLPADITNNTAMIIPTNSLDISGVTVDLQFAEAVPPLAVGNTVVLIKNVTGTPGNAGEIFEIGEYTVEISVFGGELIATVTAAPTIPYTVAFAGESINIVSQTIESGSLATKPTDPVRTNYNFNGWFTDNGTFLNKWNFETDVVTQDTNLYAKWEQVIGISEIECVSIKIYPNPVKDVLQIAGGELRINRVKIVDVTGNIIYQFNNLSNKINVSALSQGVYFVKIEMDNGIVTKKFVKE